MGYTHQKQKGQAMAAEGRPTMTSNLNRHELSAIVAMLDTLSIGTMKACDDEVLHQFKALCGYWKKMVAAELTTRQIASLP